MGKKLALVLALVSLASACKTTGGGYNPSKTNHDAYAADGVNYTDPGQVQKTRNAFQSFH